VRPDTDSVSGFLLRGRPDDVAKIEWPLSADRRSPRRAASSRIFAEHGNALLRRMPQLRSQIGPIASIILTGAERFLSSKITVCQRGG
jgi:hypothetical protein